MMSAESQCHQAHGHLAHVAIVPLDGERIEQPQLKKCRGSNLRGTDDFAKGVGQGIVDHHRRGVALLQHCLSLARQTLAAIALDLVVLAGFLWVKATTDPLVLYVAAAAMAVILVAEYVFLSRRPAQDADHHAHSHDASGSHSREDGA